MSGVMLNGTDSGGGAFAADDSLCGPGNPYDASQLSYHIGAVFIIIGASVFGAALPLIGQKVPCLKLHRYVLLLGKHVGTGVLTALCYIHLLSPANDSFASPCLIGVLPDAFTNYTNWAQVLAITSSFIMMLLENSITQVINKKLQQRAAQPNQTPGYSTFSTWSASGVSASSYPYDGHNTPESGSKALGSESDLADLKADAASKTSAVTTTAPVDLELGHSHGGLANISREARGATTYLLEFGVAIHSVIIGMTLGVSAGATFVTLLVALVFHQFFEGFALGSRVIAAEFKHVGNEIFLTLLYTLSAPVGIAIGNGIASTYNPNSVTALVVQASFDAVSAGIIFYMSYVSMIAREFPRDIQGMPKLQQAGLYIAIYAGAGIMAYIGLYL